MMRLWKVIALLCVTFVMSGCWDLKDPQDKNYYTAIGFDYADGQYIAAIQMLDMSSVAKTEEGTPNPPAPIWTGRSTGETPAVALENLYDSSQLRVFYGHVNAIVYGEEVLKHDIDSVLDLQNRYYELRYTPWVFGTKMPVRDILNVSPFFYLSPMMSILHEPIENYRQHSMIKPIQLREFITNFHEPGKSAQLPMLGIDLTTWKEDEKASPKLTISGILVMHNHLFKGSLDIDQIKGLRWVNPSTNRSQLVIEQNGEPAAVVSLEQPKVKTIAKNENGKVSFVMKVSLTGNLVEYIHPITEEEIEAIAAQKVQEEIRHTFIEGLKFQADLLQLEHTFYHQHPQQWKMLNEADAFQLKEEMLDLEVSVNILRSGKMKMYQNE